MKKTVRLVLSVLLVMSLLLATLIAAGAEGETYSKSYTDDAGSVVVTVSSATDVFGSSSLLCNNVSHVYDGFTVADHTYRKVLYAYDISFVAGGVEQLFPGNSFAVKLRLPAVVSEEGSLELYALNSANIFVPVNASVKDGFIEFNTDSFTVFAVAIPADAPVPFVNPDYTWVWVLVWIAVILIVLGIIALLVYRYIKKKKEEFESMAPTRRPASRTLERTEEDSEDAATEAEPAVEEAPAEEPAVVAVEESAVEAEPVVEEAPAEEPAVVAVEEPVVEEPAKPLININFVDESDVENGGAVAVPAVSVRFRTSFESRYIQSGVLQDYYTAIKNLLLSYKGVKSRMSWNHESFNKGRQKCAVINIKGNALLVYLNLDPANYNVKKYHFNDVSSKPKFADTPMLMKVKSERALKYVLELIADMMAALEIPALAKFEAVDYHAPYETTEQLASRGLVKVILPAGYELSDGLTAIKADVGAILEKF